MEQPNSKHQGLEEIKNLYLFEELYKFAKTSPGIALATAYMTLILSSMAYLHIMFSAFDISIIEYVILEDILATPIKKPNIILIFCAIIFVFFIADIGNRYRARKLIEYSARKCLLACVFLALSCGHRVTGQPTSNLPC